MLRIARSLYNASSVCSWFVTFREPTAKRGRISTGYPMSRFLGTSLSLPWVLSTWLSLKVEASLIPKVRINANGSTNRFTIWDINHPISTWWSKYLWNHRYLHIYIYTLWVYDIWKLSISKMTRPSFDVNSGNVLRTICRHSIDSTGVEINTTTFSCSMGWRPRRKGRGDGQTGGLQEGVEMCRSIFRTKYWRRAGFPSVMYIRKS